MRGRGGGGGGGGVGGATLVISEIYLGSFIKLVKLSNFSTDSFFFTSLTVFC